MEPHNQSTDAAQNVEPQNPSTEVAQTSTSSTSTSSTSTSSTMPHDVRDIQAVSEYASEREEELKTLADEFEKKGDWQLLWDSKVPEGEKGYIYRFSWKSTNKVNVLANFRLYAEFYRRMSTTVQKIDRDELRSEDERDNPHSLVSELSEELNNLLRGAEMGVVTTGSSALYELHSQFVAKHGKLEKMMNRVECVALKKSWEIASGGLKKALQAIDGLRSDLQASQTNYSQVCERCDQLLAQNTIQMEQQQILMGECNKMMQKLQVVLEDRKEMLDELKDMKQQQDILIKENFIIKTLLKQEIDDKNP